MILSEDKSRLHAAITYGDGTKDIEALTKRCELTRKTCKGFEESRKQIIKIDSPQIVLEIKKKDGLSHTSCLRTFNSTKILL